MRILVAGELNVDLILQNYKTFPFIGSEVLVEDATLTLGSATAICACGLGRLGNNVTFVGKLGCDPWGDLMIQWMGERGVDTSRVARDPSIKTGLTVSISSPKDRALVTFLGGTIDANRASDLPADLFRGYNHFHVSSYFLQHQLRPDLPRVLAEARAAGATTSIDPGFDPEEKWGRDLLDALAEADLFFPNEVELAAMTGESDPEAALRALRNGRTRTIAKLGAQGCATLDGDTMVAVPSFPVTPVDTTGAGDSFNAGFLHAFLRRRPLRESMQFASACGALSTLGPGGIMAQATVAEANAFLRNNGAASAAFEEE